MIAYLLKSALCLVILLLVHRLLLQREAIYQFNRFYLLAAVIGSFLIPMVEIEVPAEQASAPQELVHESDFSADFEGIPFEETEGTPVFQAVEAEQELDWSIVLWVGYGLITLVFFIRFVRNISLLVDKINRNAHVRYRGEILVLLNTESLPFSFLSYIFVSKGYFENNQLTDAIFAHEQAHVRGRHTWDNLLIEALLVPFWFHPGLYLARQAIKLNHEFIADEAALQVTPLDQYKTFLLRMMLPEKSPGLASSLNFSLTKKRFEMMKRKTANSTKWVIILSVIPIMAAQVYFFGEKITVQPEEEGAVNAPSVDLETPVKTIETNIRILSDRLVEVDGEMIPIEELSKWLDEIKASQPIVRFSANPEVKMGTLADLQEILTKTQIRHVIFDTQGQAEVVSELEKKEAYYRNAYILVEDENMEYSHKSFSQLTEKEKKGLLPPLPVKKKLHPDPNLLESWKDNSTYAIWIDGAVTPNEKLNDYKSGDFAGFFQSGVEANARSKRFPQPFQVHLYTDPYFELHFGPSSDTHRNGDSKPSSSEKTAIRNVSSFAGEGLLHESTSSLEDRSESLREYLNLYGEYQTVTYENRLFAQPVKWAVIHQQKLFKALEAKYNGLSFEDRRRVKRADFPYVKMTKNGTEVFLKVEDLTPQQRKELGC
jgi:biopolymer transport protein ExbD